MKIKSTSHHKTSHVAVKQRMGHLPSFPKSQMSNGLQNDLALMRSVQRSKQYERKLICLGKNIKQEKLTLSCTRKIANSTGFKKNRTTWIQGAAQQTGTVKQDEKIKNADSLSKWKDQVTCLIKMLKNGLTMSKCQARFAFSAYLTCIRERLVYNGCQYEYESDMANEQMDLVMRFLQRAASNLQTPLNIAIPSTKFSLDVKRQDLAEKLHEFIMLYNKETEDMNVNLELLSPNPQDDSNVLNDTLFHEFVVNATENELEEVLTVFTKINKSASIFLRSSSKCFKEQHLLCGCSEAKCQAESHMPSQKSQQGSCPLQTFEIVPQQCPNISKPFTGLLLKLANKQTVCIDSSAVSASNKNATHQMTDNKAYTKDADWLLKEKNISFEPSCKISTMHNREELFHQNSASTFDGPDYLLVQQNMIDQSRALIAKSKAKHHVLVAHTHSIQKQLVKDQHCNLVENHELSSYAPKPPIKHQRYNQDHLSCKSHRFMKTLSNGKKHCLDNRISNVNSKLIIFK